MLRIQTLGEYHSLKKPAQSKFKIRLTETTQLLPLSIDSKHVKLDSTLTPSHPDPSYCKQDIHTQTDGSCQSSTQKEGSGFVIYRARREIVAQNRTIEYIVELLDTEAIAISQALHMSM